MFFTVLTGVCLWWMHVVIQRMHRKQTPTLMDKLELD
jgi:hypothetical protein